MPTTSLHLPLSSPARRRIDPQTAGGLLAGVPAEGAAACVAQLRGLDYRAAEIGFVAQADGREPRIEIEPGAAAVPRQTAVA